ncbi:HAD-IA family hydrolase [Fictibacillus sp. NRS-1165]|uniref:HAD-IA family hydrolase n=1 Tax=Fictibacillus sp. NRS-1165 TaxID=3144463 RepID=UPI003D19329C
MIKSVIFDFDGTMADSKRVFLSVFNQLAAKHGFRRVDLEEMEYLRKLSMRERMKQFDFPVHKLPAWSTEFYELYHQASEEVTLVPGMAELLSEVNSRGYKTAIISSNSRKNIDAFLDRNRLSPMEEVICSNRLFGKDRHIKSYLKRTGLGKEEVIYVGDEARDIAACRKCGIKIIWVSWGYDAREAAEKEKPDFMVYEPKDILKVIH